MLAVNAGNGNPAVTRSLAVVLSVTALQEGPQHLKELLTISGSDHYPQSVSFCATANPYGVFLTPNLLFFS